jgi:hypothetical protein
MPTRELTIESLRRLVLTTILYGLAVVLVGVALPTVLTPMPVAAFLPKPQPVVARVHIASPPMDSAS